MSVEREQRIFELLDEALELSPRERQTFLDESCGDDAPLRQEVEALLDTEVDGGLLAEPAFNVHADDAGVGRRIGPYQLIRLIDRGGMGSVYLAEREDFEQRVALKLIRRGLDADEVLVRRFENERQILARLNHPHIARLLDGGATADRLPYFVMEYVEGEPIDRYCRTRGLQIDERLELFRRVCSAVQFAHQNLVIHRDLKPSNILITADGHPRLLDFGIAKLLDDSVAADALTELGQGPMTPRYASPEQIRLEPVTTASDVYSLGVLLYELLTGLDPYGVAGGRSDEIARAVCETEPDRPSTAVRRRGAKPDAAENQKLRRRLAGDLDSIVLKALRKEPEERYVTANQLSEDIRRHLEGLPVGAQTGTFTYRAGKFVRRHKLAIAVMATVFLIGLAFGIASTFLWLRALREAERTERERQKTETELKRAQDVSDYMKGLFKIADPTQTAGKELTALEILNRGKEKFAELEDLVLQIDVAGSLGEIFRNLGSYDDSIAMMEKSLEAARRHYRGDHQEVATRLNNLAVLLIDYEDYETAESHFREVLRMRKALEQESSALFIPKSNLAMALLRQGRLEEAQVLCREVLLARLVYYRDEAHKNDYGEDVPLRNVAASRHNLAAVYYALGRFEDAGVLLDQALDARRRVYGLSHPRVATSLDLLGSVVAGLGRDEDAERIYKEALDMRLGLLDENHRDVARTRKNLAALLAHREPDTARHLATQALEVFKDFRADGWDAAETKTVLGASLAAMDKYHEAEDSLTEGYDRMVELLEHRDTYRSSMARQRILDLSEALGRPERLERYRGPTQPMASTPSP